MKDSFRTFCKQVLSCEELIDLWSDIHNYKNIKEKETKELKVNTAYRIWNTFFVSGSVEVPQELETLLIDNLDSGDLALYDEVQTLIEDDLKEEAYHLFIKDFIKHANSVSNPLSSLSNTPASSDESTPSQLPNRNVLQQEEQNNSENLNSSFPQSITALPVNNVIIPVNGSPPPIPPAHTPPPSNSVKRGVRIERLGDKIQVYGRSPTNSIKLDDNAASNLEEYKYKGPLIPLNQEIRATVADIESSFLRSKGEKEQFTQVTCCEVSVNLLYQKIPIITQGSIEGMAEMAKKLYNLKDYLQTDNDSFVMDINSILNRCDRYSAHLQVENVESINNSGIIQMFKSSGKKPICCIIKAQVIEEEGSSFNDYLVVFYDGNESYCLFHTFEKLFPKKGLRACVTYFENLDVMERFLNDFLAPNELSASKLSNNRKYILKQLITLRKKEQELIKKYLNYRVSLQVEDSPIENIEKKLFMMEDAHRNRIEDLLNKLKDIEGKIKIGNELDQNSILKEVENVQQLENEQDVPYLSDISEELEDFERPLSPRKRQAKSRKDTSQSSSPQKSDIITEYFINRLSNIESEMNEVKNAYTKKIESVVVNLSNLERQNQSPILERTIIQQETPDSKLIYEMKKEIEMMKIARLQIEKEVNKNENHVHDSHSESLEIDNDSSFNEKKSATLLSSNSNITSPTELENNKPELLHSEKFENVSRVISDLKTELAQLKEEMNIISTRKINQDFSLRATEKSSTEQDDFKNLQSNDRELDEVVERINNIESYTYENMSNIKQVISEEKKDRFNMFDVLHTKLQSVEEKHKEHANDIKEARDYVNNIKEEIELLKLTKSPSKISDESSTISKLDYESSSNISSSFEANQIMFIQNNLKKEIVQQINQQIHQQIDTHAANVENEYRNQFEILEKKLEVVMDKSFTNNGNQDIEILDRRVSLLENDFKDHIEKTIDSKVEQIHFVNKNFNQVVNIKVESIEEKLEHLKEFVHMKTREMELSAMDIVSNTQTMPEGNEEQKNILEKNTLIQNFISQLSTVQHVQSNYDEKLDFVSKLYNSTLSKTMELSESLRDIGQVRNNVEILKQNTENKVGQLQSSLKRIDNQVEYLTRRLQQVDQQKDEQHLEKMTLFINSLSSRVDQELRKMNEYFERKEVELNDKFLEILTRERMVNMREQNLEEREDHFIRHTNNHSVEAVKNETFDQNLLLKQVQHHLNTPKVDYSLDSVLFPLTSVNQEVLKAQRITDPSERIANEFKESFLLKTPESLFSSTSFPLPTNYSLTPSNYVSVLNTETSSINSNSTSPTSSTTSSYSHPLLVTSSGMQTFEDETKIVGLNNSSSTPTTPNEASVPPKRNRRSSGSQTYKTQFKEYKKEDNSIIRSPFRKYAEQKDTHLYSSYYF